MKSIWNDIKTFKGNYLPDFTWLELIDCFLVFLWYNIIGFINFLKVFGSEYPEYNLLTGRFRTGALHFTAIHLLRLLYIEEIKLQFEVIIAPNEGKIRLNVISFFLFLNLPTSCMDYWIGGERVKVTQKNINEGIGKQKSSMLENILKFLVALQYKVFIKTATLSFNDDIQLLIEDTDVSVDLKAHSYSTQIGHLHLRSINQEETKPQPIDVVSLTEARISTIRVNEQLKIQVSASKIVTQVEEMSLLVIIRYLLYFKSMSYYKVEYLRDYLDDRFDQLLNRLEYINSKRTISLRSTDTEVQEDLIEFVRDYPNIDFHHSFYFISNPYYDNSEIIKRAKKINNINISIDEVLIVIHSKPNDLIHDERLRFTGLLFVFDIEATPGEETVKVVVNNVTTTNNVDHYAVLPRSDPIISLNFHSRVINHTSFRGIVLPLHLRLNSKTINLLLWSINELTSTLNLNTSLLASVPKDRLFSAAEFVVWEEVLFAADKLTLEIWQDEKVENTNYQLQDVVGIQLNLLELTSSSLGHPNCLQLSISDVTIGPMKQQIRSNSFHIHPSLLLLNIKGIIPYNQRKDDEGSVQIIPISNFNNFQDWDAFITSTIRSSDAQVKATSFAVQQCQVYCTNSDLKVLSILGTAFNQHSTLQTVTVDREFEVFAATVLDLSKIEFIMESVDVELEHQEEEKIHVFRVLHHQTITYESESVTNNYWSSSSFCISQPLQVLYSLRKFQNDELTIVLADRVLLNITTGKPIAFEERASLKEGKFGENESLASESGFLEDDEEAPPLTFYLKSGLSQVYWHVKHRIGFGAKCSSFYTTMKDVSICVDIQELVPLFRCINHYSGNVFRVPYNRHEDQRNNTEQSIHFAITSKIFHLLPSSVAHYTIQRFRITLLHLLKPVMMLQTSTLQYSSVAFGPHLSQSSFECTSLQVAETSGDTVKHKLIIDNMSSDLKNKLSYHQTSRTGEYGVMEFNADQLSVLYVHRAWMTLVTFLRDLFISELYKAIYSHYPGPNSLPIYTHPELPKGLYRCSIMIRRSECHLPISSFAPDGLAIIFHHLNFYCTNEYLSKYPSYLSYSMGPYLAKRIWLSEMNNIKQFTSQIFSSSYENVDMFDITDPELECRWKLAINAFQEELICKLTQEEDTKLCQPAEWYMTVELYDATIASWCNKNAVCNGQDISCTIRNRPATPNSEDPTEIINDEVYHTAAEEYRNTCIVDVLAEEIYWVLSQGQYWCIVNLIQQNFIEEYYHVQDPYIYPKWKVADVNEEIFGRDALNKDLPLISTVPVHILKGRIICIDNDSDFYETFVMEIPEGEIITLKDCHNFDLFFSCSVPSYSNHYHHRDLCWSKWSMMNKRHAPTSGISATTPLNSDRLFAANRDRDVKIDHDTDAPFCVLIEQLELDFYRLQFGGGSGIEVSATTFMVIAKAEDVKPEDVSGRQSIHHAGGDDGDENASQLSENDYDDYDVKQILLAPRDFLSRRPHLLWNEKKPSAAASSFSSFGPGVPTSTKGISKSPYHQYLSGQQKGGLSKSPLRKPQPERKPHIRYSQQSVDNMRTCLIYLDDTIVVSHFVTAMAIVDFFHTPIRVNDQRNIRLVEDLKKGRNDWKTNMDVEVHVRKSILGLPNIPATTNSSNTSMNNSAQPDLHSPHTSSANNFCFELNLDYLHGWRGFLESGPGSATMTLDTTVYATFIAPINELPTDRSCKMFDPVKIHFSNELKVLPETQFFERNYNLLKKWINFGDWIHGVNKFPQRSSGSRHMKLTIDLVEEEELDELLNDGRRRKLSKIEEIVESEAEEEDEEYEVDQDGNRIQKASSKAAIGGDDESQASERKPELNATQKVTRSRRDTQNSVNSTERAKNKKVTRGELSLKDVEFIISVITCFKGNMHRRVLRVPEKDPYDEISSNLSDIRYMPDLTYYLVYVDLPSGFKVDVKEFFTEFSDFEFMIRNNTYNLKLAKLHLSGIDANYCRHPQNLHIASQLKLSAWTFNDTIDEWEPLIEPIYMLAVALTDSTRGKSASLTSASKIQVKVDTEALELNASQVAIDNLIRKVRLNDVVTTSSKRLPPYKIVNELGIDLSFCIGYNGAIVIRDEIKAGDTCPIEVSQLSEKLEDYRSRTAYSDRLESSMIASMNQSLGTKEYLLWLSFPNFRDYYSSRVPLPIDRVGVTPFEMAVMNESELQFRKRQASVVVEGSEGVSANLVPGSDGAATSLPTFLSQTHPGIKFVKELPLTLLDMKIKEDGVRELRLKSILSFRNITHRLLHLSLRLYGSSIEMSVAPGKEWNIPVRFANPKTALFLRFDARSSWVEAATAIGNFIAAGYWGDPLRLRADVLSCPTEGNDSNENWTVLLRPDVKNVKNTTSAVSRQSALPIRYPTRETHRLRNYHHQGTLHSTEYAEPLDDSTVLSAMSSSTTSTASTTSSSLRTKTGGIIRPLCIHLQPPLQLLNLLPQPILYRLADGNGYLFASGMISPGQLVDVHNLPQLFISKLFISVRIINYAWSKWTMLLSRTNPYLSNEKHTDLLLSSLLFNADEKDFHLPSLEISMTLKEYLVRFSCQYVLSNCTGQPLLFADPSNFELNLPISSSISINKYVEGNVNTYNSAQGAGVINYRLRNERAYINLNFNDFNDDDDDTESSLYEDSSQAASSHDPYLVSDSSHDGSASNLKADNTTGNSQEPIFGLTIYLPVDHCRKVNIVAAGSWTLAELFTQIKHSFSSLPVHAQLKDYIFFPYQITSNKNLSIKAEVQELNNLVEDDLPELGGESASNVKAKGKEKGSEKDKEKEIQPAYSDQQDIPSAMRFDMAVDFRVEALLPSLPVANAPNVLILCHKTEYQIFEQSAMIQTVALEREGRFFKAMFNKTKYIHRANFIKIEGDFPFRPRKMLGFNPVVSLCIPQQTEWSAGIDFIKSDLDRGELTIRVASSTANTLLSERRMSVSREISPAPSSPVPSSGEEKLLSVFEFGAFVEKGRGIFHNTTIVTFVPKHIFYSRLPLDLEIRLIEDDRSTSSIILAANTSVNFHFPQHGNNPEANIKTFQVRQLDLANNKEPLSDWIGEFDITVLGIFYAKVVTESVTMILKVETELVGASFITTFREQNIQWPPYRIDNMTDYKLRFRQSMTDGPVPASNSTAAPNDRTVERRPSYDTYTLFSDDSGNRVLGTKVSKETKWDEVEPGSSASYCWDYPLTGFKLLQIEVMEGIQTARGVVSLDDDSKIETLTLVKSVPNIGNPLAADELLMNAMDGSDTSSILGMSTAAGTSANSQWLETYCIVRPDVIYVYRKARDSLVKVINLSIPTGYSLVSRDEEEEMNSVPNTLPKFAIVSKYVDKGWDIMGTVSSTVGFIGSMIGGNKAGIAATGTNTAQASGANQVSTGGISFDLNGVRRTILLLSDQMKLFATCTPETFNISRQTRAISDEDAAGSTPPPVPDESQIRYQNRRRSIMQRSARSNEPSPQPVVHDLRSLLQAKISVDQLLDEVCNFPIRLSDFLSAVKELKFVDNDEKAIDLFMQMFSAGYISTIEGGSTILGGASSGYFARETPDSPNSLEASRENSKQDLAELAEGESLSLNRSNQMKSVAMLSSGRESMTSSPGIFGNITDENYFDEKFEERNKDVRRYSTATDSIPGLTTSSRRPPLSRTLTNSLNFGSNSNLSGPGQMTTSLKRKLPAILESLENVDLFFNAPSIVAEFVENMNQAALLEMNPESNQMEAFGVTIYLSPTQKYHFKCSTYLAYCGWIQACRNAIEQTFVDYIVNRTNPLKRKEKLLSIEEYQVNVMMKVRADGSTKVLEILEGELEPAKINRSFASSLSSLIRGKKSSNSNSAVITKKRKAFTRAAILMPFLSGNQSLMIKHRSTSTRALNAPTDMDDNAAASNSAPADDVEQELINVSFHVNSVSLSVVDATPYEILYLRLDNINMKVLRFVDSVKFTAAVEQIDISNQLLSPSFPVALFGRKRTKDAAGGQRKFNLPGFQEMNYFATRNHNEFPALYLHLHQRYYKDSSMLSNVSSSSANTMNKDKSAKSSKGPVSVKSDIKLWYFETLTIWLTPLQLALEEEFIVRLVRYINGLRSTFVVSNDTKRSRKLKEDDLYLTSSSGGAVSALNSGSTNSSASTTSGSSNSGASSNVHPHQHQSSRMVELDAYTVYDIYSHFIESGRKPYQHFKNLVKSSLHLYFNTLQLHPLDIAFYFRPSPGIQISNAELALLSVISQLESSRLCLNALFAQHAYGSSSLMTEILVKHYRNSFWRQFHRLLSGVDPVDNTVCLVANVGGGVYDLSYESMDSVMEGEGIITTSNKGGVSSLASKALVGTSAITSKIAGGLGKGVSLLTLDTEFQRTRGYRRYVKASTVSEGLIVGTQELGKNIVEGVTGVVVAPMKGWETGGGVGFGVGVAKGVLGFALKPAVGVFDLASRATEGLRNTASTNADGGIVSQLQTIHRTRIPRAFGQLGLMVVYDAHAAAAQYMTDSLTGFKYETRINVIAHLFHKRKLPRQQHKRRTSFPHHAAVSAVLAQSRPFSLGYHLPIKSPVIAAEFAARPTEVWGLQVNTFYLTIVCPDRVALIQVSSERNYDDETSSSRFGRIKRRSSNANPSSASSAVSRPRKLSRKWIWSCPAQCIDQLCSDSNGDLMIITNQQVSLSPNTSWQSQNNLNQQQASIIDLNMQNYFVFQSLLEQSLGITLARQHPLLPRHQGICQGNIRKRYVSGLRSYIMSPTTHVYRLFGHVLYEYTRKSKKKANSKADEDGDISGGSSHAKEANSHKHYNPDESNSEEYAEHLIYQLFPTNPKDRDSSSDEDGEEEKHRANSNEGKENNDNDDDRSSGGRNDRLISTELLEQLNSGQEKEKLIEEDTRSQFSSSTIDYSRPAETGAPEDLDRDLYASSKGGIVNDDNTSDFGDRKTPHHPSSGPSSPMLMSPDARNRKVSVPASTTKSAAIVEEITEEILERDYYLSFVYPLADLFLTGPNSEENGKVFSISLSKSNAINPANNMNNSSGVNNTTSSTPGNSSNMGSNSAGNPSKMRVIKREDENEQFVEYFKSGLSLLFHDLETAKYWRNALTDRILSIQTIATSTHPQMTIDANDFVPFAPIKPDDRSNFYPKLGLSRNNTISDVSGVPAAVNISSSHHYHHSAEGSILSLLIIPTAAGKAEETERIKIEIARIKRV